MSTFNRYMRGMSGCGLSTGEALTDEQLRQTVPSMFAAEAHASRSIRIVPLPTINVLNGLRKEGFDPFFAQQARTRIAGKAEFTKHMMRLRHRSITNAGGEAFEIILVNANDGTSSYQMIPGYFRFVCANGLMVGDTFNEVKVRHSGNATSEVIEGAFTVLEDAEEITERVQRFKGITVTEGERNILAEAAHQLRFPDAYKEDGRPAPFAADGLLHTRRSDDRFSDLWTTFNVVQENTIKGGLSGRIWTAEGRTRRQRTRAVGGIDQNKALNRALWTLTERMAEFWSIYRRANEGTEDHPLYLATAIHDAITPLDALRIARQISLEAGKGFVAGDEQFGQFPCRNGKVTPVAEFSEIAEDLTFAIHEDDEGKIASEELREDDFEKHPLAELREAFVDYSDYSGSDQLDPYLSIEHAACDPQQMERASS